MQPWNSDERFEQYESLFPVLPNYVAKHVLRPKFGPEIGLPDSPSLHFAEDILTLLIANQMRVGFEYAKKKYGNRNFTEWRWLGLTNRIDSIYKKGRNGLGWYASLGLDLPKRPGSFEDLSIQFFYRNLASFDAAKRLSELGYLCEVAVILRSALEQFAFAEELWEQSGAENLESFRPNRSIGWLKRQVPASGRLYGLLSKYAHFEYDHHTHFFARSSDAIHTIQRGSVLRAYATQILFVTMACIGSEVLRNAPSRLNKTGKPISSLSDFLAEVDQFSDDVCRMLPTDLPLAELDVLLQSFTNRAEPIQE